VPRSETSSIREILCEDAAGTLLDVAQPPLSAGEVQVQIRFSGVT
jgi:hypothetical protein